MSLFLFPDDNWSKYQWIFTKIGMCINTQEIWFGIANWQITPTFDRVICPPYNNGGVLLFHVFIYKWNNFCDFLFAFLQTHSHMNRGLL